MDIGSLPLNGFVIYYHSGFPIHVRRFQHHIRVGENHWEDPRATPIPIFVVVVLILK